MRMGQEEEEEEAPVLGASPRLERGMRHRQAELGLSQVACQPIDCCDGAAAVTSCWYQRARETVVCRAQGKMQVKSGHLSGLGMKRPAGDWVGEVGSALPAIQPPSHPTASLPGSNYLSTGNGLKRGGADFCAPESSLSWSFLPCCLPMPLSSGHPGQLVVPKDRAVEVARAVRGDYFCRFVKNKTKAGL